MAVETIKELPDECWGIIFNHIDHENDLESISLVCKRFLSITNSSRINLKIFSPSVQEISKLLQRFPNLKKIQLPSFVGNLNEAVHTIARSELDLKELDLSGNRGLRNVGLKELSSKMKNLKVLDCSGCLGDDDLISIANLFPQLEELQIGSSGFNDDNGEFIVVTDEGIEYLSKKLRHIRKINFSHNSYITDKSLRSLSSNCVFLEHISIFYCGVTESGFSFLINNTHHLKSMILSAHFEITSFGSTVISENLQSLTFISVGISDEFLYYIAEARIPLTDLSILFCKNYTSVGFSRLIHSYQSLKSLVLIGANFLTNEYVKYLSSFLQSLVSISLSDSPELSDSAFVTLTQRCPLLCNVEMRMTSLGREEYNYDGLKKNFTIKHLDLSSNSYLSTTGLKMILNICLKVEKIKLYSSFQRNNQLDLANILACNRGLVDMDLNMCEVKISTDVAEISMIEKLDVQYSGITDEVLAMLGRMCPRLIHLSLADCENLTEEGVKEVIKSCKRLRFLSLSACENVDVNIIAWIVANSPCLRRLISPSYYYPNEEEQNHFLQQGCLVSKGADYENYG